jgi:hypothetical protein
MGTVIILLLFAILIIALWFWRLWFAMTHPEHRTDCGFGRKKHLHKMNPEVAMRLAEAARYGVAFNLKRNRRVK